MLYDTMENMKNKIKIITKVLGVALLLPLILLFSCGKNTKNIMLATGGTSGTYYPFGEALCSLWETYIPKSSVIVLATNASQENVRLLDNSTCDFAIVQNDIMDYAYNGTDLFENAPFTNIATIGTLYPEVVQIATTLDSDINTIADLRGKRVCVGASGSGVECNARQILAAFGISFNDIKTVNLSFKEATDSMQNDMLDACFVTAGVPNAALMELADSKGIRLLDIDAESSQKIIQKHGFYTSVVIPKNTYKGEAKNINALAVMATLACRKDYDEMAVYEMTKALFEHTKELATLHIKAKEVNARSAINGCSVPLHSGALRYFTEVNLVK